MAWVPSSAPKAASEAVSASMANGARRRRECMNVPFRLSGLPSCKRALSGNGVNSEPTISTSIHHRGADTRRATHVGYLCLCGEQFIETALLRGMNRRTLQLLCTAGLAGLPFATAAHLLDGSPDPLPRWVPIPGLIIAGVLGGIVGFAISKHRQSMEQP